MIEEIRRRLWILLSTSGVSRRRSGEILLAVDTICSQSRGDLHVDFEVSDDRFRAVIRDGRGVKVLERELCDSRN